jgi:hypothetical protein
VSGFVVIMRVGDDFVAYGPAPTRESADDFAQFLNIEVDPATVVPLRSPTAELLWFWRTFRADIERNNAATPAEVAVAHERLTQALDQRRRRINRRDVP